MASKFLKFVITWTIFSVIVIFAAGLFHIDLMMLAGLISILGFVALIPGVWVYSDADKRGHDSPGLISFVMGFLFILGIVPGVLAFFVYIIARNDIGKATDSG